MSSEEILKKAYSEIENGNGALARKALDEYKSAAASDWRLSAGYYFTSGKNDKEYIMKAAKYAREAEGVDEEVITMLDELKDLLWDIEDGSDAFAASRTDASRAEKKVRDRIINIVIGVVFVIGGFIGLIPGNMGILSVIMMVIGISLIVIQIKTFFEDKVPVEETDPGAEKNDKLFRKNELDKAVLKSITRTFS